MQASTVCSFVLMVLLQRAAGWQLVLHRPGGRIAAFVSGARPRAALQGAARRIIAAAPAFAQQPSDALHASQLRS